MSNVFLPPYGPSPVGTEVGVGCKPRTSSPTKAASKPDSWTSPPMDTTAVMLMLCAKAEASTDQSGSVEAGGEDEGGGGSAEGGDGSDGASCGEGCNEGGGGNAEGGDGSDGEGSGEGRNEGGGDGLAAGGGLEAAMGGDAAGAAPVSTMGETTLPREPSLTNVSV